MESEASLLMANQALANPGKWIYDPFAGTGSLLLTASAFGACTFGSDIDGRQIRGKSAFPFWLFFFVAHPELDRFLSFLPLMIV